MMFFCFRKCKQWAGVVLVLCAGQVSFDAHAEGTAGRGRALYLSHGCAVCHGENGDGKGIVPRKLDPPAIDFRDTSAFRYGHDKASIMTSIKRGAKQPGSVMPAYGHLSKTELETIAEYVASLASARETDAEVVRVLDAWVRWQPPVRPNSAAFMVIDNRTKNGTTLIAVSSDVVERIELHAMENEGGVMRMREVKEIHVPAHSQIELRSGGLHLMLFGIAKPLQAGENIPLVLKFKDGPDIKVQAVIKGLDEE